MNTLNIAVFGCGSIALQNHLPGFASFPDIKLGALCDNNPAPLENTRQQTTAVHALANVELHDYCHTSADSIV